MKCHPLRWVWGLVPVLGLGYLATQVTHQDIEADLKARTEAQLHSAGFRWANATFSGRDGTITGMAVDEADPGRAYDITRAQWGVRVADNQATVVEKVAEYQWTAARSGQGLTLSGYVPNEAVRADILARAKADFPGASITDNMKLARGVPAGDGWLTGVKFALKQLASLKSGEAHLKNLALTVSGEAGDLQGYAAVKKALASALPADLKLVDERIAPPVVKPFVWTARLQNGQVVLSGYVPPKLRDDVRAAAKAAFPRNTTIDDRMEVAEGAAPGFAAATALALRELARLENGAAEIKDQALALSGLAATVEVADATRKELGGSAPQGFKVSDALTVRDTGPKPVSPYTTSFQADPSVVRLLGYAPSEAAREQLGQAARTRFPGRSVDNQLKVAPGAPDGWLRCLDGALGGAGKLGNGRVSLTDRRVDFAATTDDEDLAGAVPNEIKSSVEAAGCTPSVHIDMLAEAVPDLTWRARYDGREVILDGDVPSASSRAQLLAAARRAFAGKSITDQMRVVEMRSRTWPLVAEQGLVALADLQNGEARLARQNLTVQGQAVDAATATRVRARIAQGLAKGYGSKEEITIAAVAPPPVQPTPQVVACQASLRDKVREGKIQFERASAALEADSFPTLDKIVTAINNCPKVTIEIGGHTDDEGTPERNKALSDRRAKSVLTYLVRGGVDERRLVAVGYGETRPLVPNTTPEGRAQNRRIELVVKDQ